MNTLEENSSLFTRGGVLGRRDYVINSAKLTGLMLLAWIPIAIGFKFDQFGIIVGSIFTFIALIPIFYFGFHNVFKRLRDIRGTTKDEILAVIVTYVFMIIPYIGLIPALALLFMKGKITSKLDEGEDS